MDPVCEIYRYDEEKVKRLQPLMTQSSLSKAAQLFKMIADETRMKIAYALSQEDELCVCDIANIVGCTTANASYHLRLMNNLGLTKYRKEGKLVFYSLDDDHVRQLVWVALTHVEEARDDGETIESQ